MRMLTFGLQRRVSRESRVQDPELNKVWACAVTGGLWFNNNITDDDSEWIPVNDLWPNLAMTCITYDPVNTKTFFVGTGEPQTAVTIYRESLGRGMGIWHSDDAGQSWEIIPSTADFAYITDICVRNENGKGVIYAGVVSGCYKGADYEAKPSNGLFRSADNGESWTQVLPNIPGESEPYSPADIEIAADGRIFVGTMRNLNNKGGGVILYSDNGTDWTTFDNQAKIIEKPEFFNIQGRVTVALASSDKNRVYAIIASAFYVKPFVYSTLAGKQIFNDLLKATNGQISFTIDLTASPKGIYIATLRSGNQQKSERIVLE